ncbi:Zn-dependent hydrolase [Endozoicomonas sp. OPT23]|uniref:MBL fold metallo-hydrolase n=1 Tax=Endozoicomonas sp. OPT23 TaxID=2072845 RepID=UPI00129ACF52|nr:MBL fold metallo-hydrolase [Endozoicomonas sp. OPT23]MRI31870.1 Zn-dependent hydrolase [Endozoicomonas sp. OPT23]
MFFRQYFDTESCAFSYLLADKQSRKAVIVDSVKGQTELYLNQLKELSLNLKIVMDSHIHADHITASGLLKKETGCRLLQGEPSYSEGVTDTFNDGDLIQLDALGIRAIHTPGHTDDSYCFFIDCESRPILLTGDTLLIRGTGRTDFQNGSANEQYHSLFEKLKKLPEHTRIYPAHDYHGMTESTLREEFEWNPRLKVSTKEEYIEQMKKLNLPKPARIDQAVPANLKCGIE